MEQLKIEQLSYWEKSTFFNDVDLLIIGAGIVGASTALAVKEMYPLKKILILERGYLPTGASTKNAGFACFGSVSELLDDIQSSSEAEVINLVRQRWEGLQILRNRLGDHAIDYQCNGSYEIFSDAEKDKFDSCVSQLNKVNQLIEQAIGLKNCFSIKQDNPFDFKGICGTLYSPYEGQIDTGKMMTKLHQKLIENDIFMLNGITVNHWHELKNKVIIDTNIGEIESQQLVVCTNGLTSLILPDLAVQPARAQVLITKPIQNLKLKGIFHYQEGYYYLRNIHNRILFGGARNLDFEGETTTAFGNSTVIKEKLIAILRETILPNQPFEVDYFWSGIMGVGATKSPLIGQLSNQVFYGIRLGGMGIALGSKVGYEIARLINTNAT